MTSQLSQDRVRHVVTRYFFNVNEEAIDTMTAIVMAESGGKIDALGDNFKSGHQTENSVYRWDYGLAQINSVHDYDSKRLVTDADYNLWAARQIYSRQGFRAWTTYKGGQYKKFMPVKLSPRLSLGRPHWVGWAWALMRLNGNKIIELEPDSTTDWYKVGFRR